jgi:hypothetical protein
MMRELVLCLLCLAWAVDLQAQRIIYDGKRDTTAQQASAAAKEVTSGTLFQTMLGNVDAQAKLEVETEMAFVQERMRSRLNAFKVWYDPRTDLPPGSPPSGPAIAACSLAVECTLRTLRNRHQAALAAPLITAAQLDQRLAAIKAKSEQLKAELKALQEAKPSKDPLVVRLFEALDDPGRDLFDYAEKIVTFAKEHSDLANGVANALDAVEEGLDQVVAIYRAVASIWRGQQAVSVDPASLRPPPQQIDLQLLVIEQAHLKAKARIEARRQIEVGAALAGVETGLQRLTMAGVNRSTETIEATLRGTAPTTALPTRRDVLLAQLLALHEAAAAIAQMDAADHLAELRQSDEERRYSIRRSGANASTYDLTIQAAVQRLALYWKGGIKPTELAQFVFYVTNTFAIPALALK